MEGDPHDGAVGVLIASAAPTREASSTELSVAAQLVEAARRARAGDREATRAHIAHAVMLLQGMPSSGPSAGHVVLSGEGRFPPAGLLAWRSRRVIAHIEASLCGSIRVRELAELVDLSVSHFCRAFKRSFGASPRAYVLRRRIELAQGLMLTTHEPLSSIALRCGMCDQAHFTRSFRRIVGETPRSWRRARCHGTPPLATIEPAHSRG
jgi:AraC family transcriptional regulator